MNYYNDISGHACLWLSNLANAGHIPAGMVDERSITDVSPADLRQFRQCHFFAGIGGWAYAARLAGWPDDRELWTASLPCQPFSNAGSRKGIADERHLWPVMRGLVRACRPPVVMGEQVAAAVGRHWWDVVADDLEADGYTCRAVIVPACAVGAWHRRDRLYWIATDAQRDEQSRQESCGRAAGRVGRIEQPVSWDASWQDSLARLRTVDDGFPRCVAGTDAARNAIVPQVAAEVIAAFMETQP